jgi:hypothetical protein
MKVTIDMDMTPEEGRRFFGLPDVQPMQQALIEEVQRHLMANLQAMTPEQLMKTWFPAGPQSWEQMQRAFWDQMTGGAKKEG